jgi:hypothetical protein
LLSWKDIEHWRPPKDVPCKAAYFTYQAQDCIINIGGLNWGNRLAKTGTEPACFGFPGNHYNRSGLKLELLVTLAFPHSTSNPNPSVFLVVGFLLFPNSSYHFSSTILILHRI